LTILPILASGLWGLGLSGALIGLAQLLLSKHKTSPDISRKAFHVGVFSGAAPAYLFAGFWGAIAFGVGIASLILLAIRRGKGSRLYEVLARKDEGPEANRFLLVPLVSTALGGLLGALFVGEFVVVGFLVCGWGDALAEIVGSRWGRIRFRPPFGRIDGHTRSLEGSVSALLAGMSGAWVALEALEYGVTEAVLVGLLCGLAGAIAEAVSSHGTDNFFMQLAPTLTAWWLLG
jgi:phytol kinase